MAEKRPPPSGDFNPKKISSNWNDAMAYAADYVPDAYRGTDKENDATFGKGKWHLPSDREGIDQVMIDTYEPAYFGSTWMNSKQSDNAAYFITGVSGISADGLSASHRVVPVLMLTY